MHIDILTLFPDMVESFFRNSIMARAVSRGIISYNLIDFRAWAEDRHRTCDDVPYGGGAGMVLKPEPISKALDSIDASACRVIYPSPSGRLFNQALAEELSKEQRLVFICGHYEGLDQRVIDTYVTDEISIGDYVLSSGESAATVIIDAVYRLVDGVITPESLEDESFSSGLLEYPQYTRPEVIDGVGVPEVLMSGNHEKIRRWRLQQALARTYERRPDLLQSRLLNREEHELLAEYLKRKAAGEELE